MKMSRVNEHKRTYVDKYDDFAYYRCNPKPSDAATPLVVLSFYSSKTQNVVLRGEVLTFSIMHLTFADFNTTRTFHFEAN